MPLSRLRRPLFLALLTYMAALAGLRQAGLWSPGRPASPRAASFSRRAEVEGSVRLGPGFGREPSVILDSPARPGVLVYLPAGASAAPPRPGAILRAAGRLRGPRRPRNPGDFDERSALAARDVDAVLHADRVAPVAFSPGPLQFVLDAAHAARVSLGRTIDASLAPSNRGLMRGLLLGDKSALDRDLARDLKNTGGYHIIVPSGTNVGLVLLSLVLLSRLGGLPRRWGAVLGLPAAGFYGLIVGGDPPFLRAWLCAACAVWAALRGRGGDVFQALVLSCWALLAVRPAALFEPSFQMSYLVVFSFLIAEPGGAAPKSLPRPLRAVAALAAATAVAQIVLAPIMASLGGRVALAGALANLALVPLSTVLLVLGCCLWAVSWAGPQAAAYGLARATDAGAAAFRLIGGRAAELPFASVELAAFSAPGAAAYYLAAASLLVLRSRRLSRGLAAASLAAACLASLAERVSPWEARVTGLARPARALIVRFPGGRSWLVYGSGPPSAVLRAWRACGGGRPERLATLSSSPRRNVERLSRALRPAATNPIARAEGLELCRGEVCFRLDPADPGIRVGGARVTPPRWTSWTAWQASTDGRRLVLRKAAQGS